MIIELPKSLAAMRIHHAESVMKFKGDLNYPTIGQRVEFLRPFVRMDKEALLKISAADINKMFTHVVQVLASYKYEEPPKYLKLEGKEFTRVADFGQGVPVALHIDVDQFRERFKDEPELVAAFTYIEKGMAYAEQDENGAVINSVFDRAKFFKEHLPLDVHLNTLAFFLRKSKQLIPAYMALQQARVRALAESSTLGKKL